MPSIAGNMVKNLQTQLKKIEFPEHQIKILYYIETFNFKKGINVKTKHLQPFVICHKFSFKSFSRKYNTKYKFLYNLTF